MPYVFLSHSHQDKPFARMLAADLRSEGHAVWLDEAEIKVGDSLVEKIAGGLREVDYVAAILSSHSVESPWVARELDIAANREIAERRVVVLPLLLEEVQMPPFLEGKLYADFRDKNSYQDSLANLLEALGDADKPPKPTADEIAELHAELDRVREMAAREAAATKRAEEAAYAGKSEELKRAIDEANESHPEHAPINKTYAFEVGGEPVTLDHAFWAIAKAGREGSHPLEALLTMENQWGELKSMLEAYADMLEVRDQAAGDE